MPSAGKHKKYKREKFGRIVKTFPGQIAFKSPLGDFVVKILAIINIKLTTLVNIEHKYEYNS